MNVAAILAFISWLIQYGPSLGAEAVSAFSSIQKVFTNNPGATLADVQADIQATLAAAQATDKQIEQN